METQADRLNFAIDTAQQTKRELVSVYGIGEEVPLTLIAWSQGKIRAVGKVHAKLAAAPQRRFEVVASQAFAFRKGCSMDAITMLCEGFTGTHDVPSMPQRFAEGDLSVRECLLALHVEAGETEGYLVKIPYTYLVGRAVACDQPDTEMVPLESGFPGLFGMALRGVGGDVGVKPVAGVDLEVFE